MALSEPPEQRAARERTTDEDRALEARTLADHLAEKAGRASDGPALTHADIIAKLKAQHAEQVAKAHRGQYNLPIGES